jgi:transposase-like protein
MTEIWQDYKLGVDKLIYELLKTAFVRIDKNYSDDYLQEVTYNEHDKDKIQKLIIVTDEDTHKYRRSITDKRALFDENILMAITTIYYHANGFLKNYKNCIYCGSNNISLLLQKNNNRCYSCKGEWSGRKGSVIESTRFKIDKFLACMRFFDEEIPIDVAPKILRLSRSTTMLLYHYFRKCIAGQDLVGELGFKLDPDHVFIKSIDSKYKRITSPVVIGIKKQDYNIKLVPFIKNKPLTAIINNMKIKKALLGPIVFTDKYDEYLSIMIYGLNPKKSEPYSSELNELHITHSEFWAYLTNKKRLINRAYSDANHFILYLNELCFRYNHRFDIFFEVLYKTITMNDIVYVSEEEIYRENILRLNKIAKNYPY